MAKELNTKEALEQALKAMAGDRILSPASEVSFLSDLRDECEKRIKALREFAQKDLKKQLAELQSQMKALGISTRGRGIGSKNKPKEAAQNG